METDEEGAREGKGGGAELSISLHPLVVINIADHSMRKRAQQGNVPQRVLGILLGVQEGRNVELCNSFELDYNTNGEKLQIDMEFLNIKQEQYKKVFPKYEMLGWYSNSTQRVKPGEALPGDIEIHREIGSIIENPLYLILDTSEGAGIRDLPVHILESEVHIIDDVPALTFARSTYHLETEEAERVSVDQVSHLLPAGASSASSVMSSHMSSVHSAVTMLQKRVQCILSLLQAMEKGEVKKDHRLLRQVASLCQRLPATDTPDFKEDLLQLHNDTMLVTYLATMTKGTNSINELIDKYNIAFDKQSRRRGGLF
uniref:COP9 signalosome complex subunit 6 n=1 Tax=Guillardia theta TaxID=55529 RepID=A0A7S4M1B1_GUITH|mmetsp:Transcript_132/g.303  ORF Transcript_132/g.303 Transcript_132/m.303 type:complete len:314 (+) Transcript_132:1-942(+)